MKTVSKFIILGAVLVFAIYLVSQIETYNRPVQTIPETLGSAVNDGAYRYKSITSANATSTAGVIICGGPCTLGRITVGSTTLASVVIYDGASTATSSLTKIGRLSPLAPAGTYNYEVSTLKGITLDLTSYAGEMTISYK